MLQERGGAQSGVATHSLHMDGKAIDIRVPGIKLGAPARLRQGAEARRRRLLSRIGLRTR